MIPESFRARMIQLEDQVLDLKKQLDYFSSEEGVKTSLYILTQAGPNQYMLPPRVNHEGKLRGPFKVIVEEKVNDT